jgi:hypothetical protein
MKIISTLIAVLAAYLLAFAYEPGAGVGSATTLLIPISIIFAIVFGLLASIAINRRERLKAETATELNKLRRIYHLSKNLGMAPYLRSWFTDLHGFIYDYLGGFDKFDLSQYEKGNALFRRIAYHVYTIPELHEVKEEVLYNELLEATAAVSDARQKITTLYRIRYANSHWFELTVLVLAFTVSTVIATGDSVLARVFTANLLIAGYVLMLTFLFHDTWTKPGDKRLAMEYVKNIARLELRRG